MTSTVVLVQCLMTQKYSWHLPYIPSLNLTGWKIKSRRHWYWNNGNKQLPQNIEERRCSKTVQQHLHVNQTRIRLRLLQPLLHQRISLPARKEILPLLGQMQMLKWNHIFQILPPNCRPWKPIRISAKLLEVEHRATSQCRSRTSVCLGGRVFSPLRPRLSSEHFEMTLFLHTAAKW